MKTLFIDACVNPASRTMVLAKHLLSKISGEITEVNLDREGVIPLTEEAFMKRGALLSTGNTTDESFRHARQFAEADTVIIASPYWNLGLPASVKAYFDDILVKGITFRYDENGIPRGLARVKKIIFITTSGGPIFADFAFSYIKTAAEVFFGITDVSCYKAEGLDVIGNNVDVLLSEAKAQIDKDF